MTAEAITSIFNFPASIFLLTGFLQDQDIAPIKKFMEITGMN